MRQISCPGLRGLGLAAGLTLAMWCGGARAQEVVVDNTAATATGSWTSSTSQPNYYGTDYLTAASGATSASIVWRPNLASAGRYNVYYYLPDGAQNRTPGANFRIDYQGGSKTYSVNERATPGGKWIWLDALDFAKGTTGAVTLTNTGANGVLIADAVRFVPASVFTVTNTAKQTILGLGVEIQNDSIGSGNIGMPPEVEGIPHDLVPSERARLYKDLLKGFRYARLAMGLYYRGLSADQKTIGPRYASQNTDLAELIAQSGMEGVAAEYFSPGPGWKSNNDWVQGSLKQFDPTFLGQFGDNAVTELQQLQSHSIPVKMWGLQNEPSATPTYSSAVYTRDQYYQTFKAVAPKIRAAFPQVLIHANSLDGQNEMGDYPGPITSDADALKYLDAWTWHCIGCDSRKQMQQGGATASGKMVFNNEFEYLDKTTSPARLVNTAQSIMNWMTFNNSPTWFWLHALKPAGDTTAMGYGLGVWRKPADTDLTHWPNVQSGYFDYIPNNYNAIAGFLSYMPWNSTRYDVTEKDVSRDQRVMAWKTPAGKLVFAVTNRTGLDTGYRVNLPSSKNFTGYLFDSTPRNATQADGTGQYKGKPLGPKSGSVLDLLIPDLSIQFWVEN